MDYRPLSRGDFVARVDGLHNELRRLSLYANECIDPRDATHFSNSLRALSQWCDHMLNDKESD